MKLFPEVNYQESASPDITLWKLTRSAIEHENNLINHRMTWLFTSQGFFFAMFGLVFAAHAKDELKQLDYEAPYILGTIAALAGYFCISVRISVRAAEIQLDRLTHEYDHRCQKEQFLDRLPTLHQRSPDRTFSLENLPGVFLLAWIFLFAVVVLSQKPTEIWQDIATNHWTWNLCWPVLILMVLIWMISSRGPRRDPHPGNATLIVEPCPAKTGAQRRD